VTNDQAVGRQCILAEAQQLFFAHGYHGASVREIVQACGLSNAALYYHFGSKEGLLGAVVEAVAEAWLDQLEAAQPAQGDLAARLRMAVDGWQAMIEDPARPMKLLLSVQLDGADTSPEIRTSLQRVYERAREVVAEGIRAAAGELPELNALADQVLGLVQGAALAFHLESDRKRLRARLCGIAHLIETRVFAAGPRSATPLHRNEKE